MPREIASLPEAQAETGVCTPALAPIARPTLAAGPLGISIGIASGETRRGPFSLQQVVVVEERGDTADARGHRHGEALGIDGVTVGSGQGVPGVGPRLERRHHGELPRAVHPTGLDPVEDLGRLDLTSAAIWAPSWVGPLVLEPGHAGRAVQQGLPGGGYVATDGGRRTETGDDYALVRHGIPSRRGWISSGRISSGRSR